jgi:hypothetical protein
MGKPPYPHDLLVKGGRARGLQQCLKTHCPHGHPYDEANTRLERRGGRVCRTCHRESERRRHQANLTHQLLPPKAEAHTSKLGTINR